MATEEYGSFYKTAATITDWDAVLENGFYMGNNACNSPVSAQDKWFIGYVLRHNDKYVVQRVFSFNTDRKWYERYRNRDGWSDWVEDVLLTKGEKEDWDAHLLDLEKHITAAERKAWNGKAEVNHNHDERYYTESEMDGKLISKAEAIHNHDTSYDAKGAAEAVEISLNSHTGNKANPHGVTAAQVGAAKLDSNGKVENEQLTTRTLQSPNLLSDGTLASWESIAIPDAILGAGWTKINGDSYRHAPGSTKNLSFAFHFVKGEVYEIEYTQTGASLEKTLVYFVQVVLFLQPDSS